MGGFYFIHFYYYFIERIMGNLGHFFPVTPKFVYLFVFYAKHIM